MVKNGDNNLMESNNTKNQNQEVVQSISNDSKQMANAQNNESAENVVLKKDEKQADPVLELEKRVKALEEENASLSDRLLRVYADFDNFRKRMVKESSEIETRTVENIFITLLPVVDNASHAVDSLNKNELENEKIKGFKSIIDDLLKTFEKFGIVVEKPDKGIFDPKRHEAITAVPSEEIEENHIVKLFRPGYVLKNKVIRPAQVIVSSGKSIHKKHHQKSEQKHEGSSSDAGNNSSEQ